MPRQFAIVIPARLASTRLAQKLLLDASGQPLICHTVEAANRMGAAIVAVASDSDEILAAVGDACLTIKTSESPKNGTERVAEAIESPLLSDYDVFVNVQGDEPELPPEAAERAVAALDFADLGTIGSLPLKPNQSGVRIHSRPNREAPMTPYAGNFTREGSGRLHHGVYAYHRKTIQWYARTPQHKTERRLSLEQMRFIEHGRTVAYQMINGTSARRPVDDLKTYQAFVARVTQSRT